MNKNIDYMATNSLEDIKSYLGTDLEGLSEEAVQKNREKYGANKVKKEKKKSLAKKLEEAFINPFTVVLVCLAVVSTVTDIVFPLLHMFGNTKKDFNPITVIIILTMVFVSGVLRFIQEGRSGDAAEKLLAMIKTTCTVTRKNKNHIEIPLDEAVVGDIVYLSAGDMIPADVRIIEAKDLFVSQSSLSGESEPIEKLAGVCEKKDNITEYTNIAFMGSSVISGSAAAVVIAVGDNTLFGSMTLAISGESVETNFTKGVNAVSWVLIRFMLVMVPLVFVINGVTKGNWISAFLFAISVAVGLTPEMLPMIVTSCLAKGAVSMSKKKTIVKNLNSIQNFGAMDILCTDKTGTLTQDRVVLEYHLNIKGDEDSRVLRYGYLNSYFQTGYKNLMDLAIIQRTEEEEENDSQLLDLSENYKKIDEIPFDFNRRRLTTVVQNNAGTIKMVTKGAFEEMLSICSFAEYNGNVQPITNDFRQRILETADTLNEKGFRVLAIARKDIEKQSCNVEDESEMILMGYLAFLDPPKESAANAIKALKEHGVRTKILTGDNEKTASHIAKKGGITHLKYELKPSDKQEFIQKLQQQGKIVAMVGDGINDSQALAQADVSIAMGKGSDVAMEVAQLTIISSDLLKISKTINLSIQTLRTIKQNLFWAFIYNLIGIPIAAGVLYFITNELLNPMYAGAAMAFSSVSVVGNSLLLKRKKI